MQQALSAQVPTNALNLSAQSISEALKPVSDALCTYPGVMEAALWWRIGAGEGIVSSPKAGTPERNEAEAPIAAIARAIDLLEPQLDRDSPFVLDPAELRALREGASGPIAPELLAVARAGSVGNAQVRAIVLAMRSPEQSAVLAAAELGWRAAGFALSAAEKEGSREFWRGRAASASDECARLRTQSASAATRNRAQVAALETALAEHRTRSAKLALRMFTVVDEERARIARDLHDDQAQVLAAAQIALEKGGPEALRIFRRASDNLRRSVRALGSAALGERDLERALREQFRLLSEGGIEPKLTLGPGAKRLSRMAQQLCWHVAREALANVIRHSKASHVEVTILRQAAGAVISITDDGRGIGARSGRERGGLDGLGERLHLMGGKITVESATGATRVIAEIPELA